jgi:hypothetical protein
MSQQAAKTTMSRASKCWSGICSFRAVPATLLPVGNTDHGYALEQREIGPPGG